MAFDENAFTLALAFLGQANSFHPYANLDPLQFLRALAYLQPYSIPIEIMVTMLHHSNVRQWAKFYVLARTFFPKDHRLITVLENYNLWHVRLRLENLRTLWVHPTKLFLASRATHRVYSRYARGIQHGRCIICEADIARADLLSPTNLRNIYMTACCAYYAHFDCWLSVSQEDYTCRICRQRYNSGHMSPLHAPPVTAPNSYGIYARMLTSFWS